MTAEERHPADRATRCRACDRGARRRSSTTPRPTPWPSRRRVRSRSRSGRGSRAATTAPACSPRSGCSWRASGRTRGRAPSALGEAPRDRARVTADESDRTDREQRDREQREERPHRDRGGERAPADLGAPALDDDVDLDDVGHAGPERHVTYRGTVHALATGLLVAAGVSAVGNWIAVARGSTVGIYVCKPLTLVLHDRGGARARSDVGRGPRLVRGRARVLAPRRRVPDAAVGRVRAPGSSAFLLAHVAYVVGLNQDSAGNWWLAVPVVVVAAILGRRLVAGIRRSGHAEMVVPVVAYVRDDPRDGGERAWRAATRSRRSARCSS